MRRRASPFSIHALLLVPLLFVAALPSAGSLGAAAPATTVFAAEDFLHEESAGAPLALDEESPLRVSPPPAPPEAPQLAQRALASSGHGVIARAGAVERSAPLRPLVPTGLTFDSSGRPLTGLGVADDVVVTLTPTLGGGFRIDVAVSKPGSPLEVVVHAPLDGRVAYAGFASAQAPAHVGLLVEAQPSGVLVDLATRGGTADLEAFAGDAENLVRAHLSPAPSRMRVHHSSSLDGGGSVRFEAEGQRDVRIAAAGAHGHTRVSIEGAPDSLFVSYGPGGARWSASGAAESARVERVTLTMRLEAALAPLPTEGRLRVVADVGNVSAILTTPAGVADASLLLERDGSGVLVHVADAPRHLQVATTRMGETRSASLEADAGVGALFAAAGDLRACRVLPDAFLAASAECVALRLLDVHAGHARWGPDGVEAALEGRGSASLRLVLDGAIPARLVLTPLPASVSIEARFGDGDTEFHAHLSERARLTGFVGEAAPALPREGWAFAPGGPAAAFDLLLPRALTFHLEPVRDGEDDTASIGGEAAEPPRGSLSLLAATASAWPEELHVHVAAGERSHTVTWESDAPAEEVTLTTKAAKTRTRVSIAPLPASGSIHASPDGLAYDLGEPVRLDVRVLHERRAGALVPLPDVRTENSLRVGVRGDGVATALHLAHAPARGNVSWTDGFRLAYDGGVGGFLAIAVDRDGHRFDTEIPLPLSASVGLTRASDGSTTHLHVSYPGGLPALDVRFTDADGAASLLSLRRIPERLDLVLDAGDGFRLAYEANAPGLLLSAGGPGQGLGLGAGGSLEIPHAPARAIFALDATGARVESAEGLSAAIVLGDARWGSPWLGFSTSGTRIVLDDVHSLDADFNIFGAVVRGEGRAASLHHAPRGVAGHLVLPGFAAARGGLDHASVDLSRPDAGFVLYALNAHAVLFDVAPPLAFALAGGIGGGLLARSRRGAAALEAGAGVGP